IELLLQGPELPLEVHVLLVVAPQLRLALEQGGDQLLVLSLHAKPSAVAKDSDGITGDDGVSTRGAGDIRRRARAPDQTISAFHRALRASSASDGRTYTGSTEPTSTVSPASSRCAPRRATMPPRGWWVANGRRTRCGGNASGGGPPPTPTSPGPPGRRA